MNSFDILVYVLGGLLGLLLVLIIIIAAFWIAILRRIKGVAESLQTAAGNLEDSSYNLRQGIGPIKFVKSIVSIISKILNRAEKRSK